MCYGAMPGGKGLPGACYHDRRSTQPVAVPQGVLKKGEPWPTELPKARLRDAFLARLLPTTRLTRGISIYDTPQCGHDAAFRPRSIFIMNAALLA